MTLRFVVLEHETPPGYDRGRHWDLMLEDGPALRTWALERPPDEAREMAAEPLEDHRTAYLDYEGPISGNRGSVRRWDRGTFCWLERDVGRLCIELAGERLQGRATLVRESPYRWRFSWSPD